MSKKIPERSEIAIQDQWALEDLYATDELWQEDLKKLQAEIDELAGFAGRISQSAQELLAYRKLVDMFTIRAERLGNYAIRRGTAPRSAARCCRSAHLQRPNRGSSRYRRPESRRKE